MRVGVVSDTHDNVANVGRIVELFNASRVERVIHTGDITGAVTLDVMAHLAAPLLGVYGNNDKERHSLAAAARRHDMHFVDPPLSLTLAGRAIAVVHDPEETGLDVLADHRVLLHGHTHRRVHEKRDGKLVLNPGECAGRMPGRNVVGVLDLVTLGVEFLTF